MKELSVFVDESGDFGGVENNTSYYLVTLVFHDQRINISNELKILNERLANTGIEYLHSGLIIRREAPFDDMKIDERRKFLYMMLNFYMKLDIKHYTICIERNEKQNKVILSSMITKELKRLFDAETDYMHSFDKIILYYDNGQEELTSVLSAVFTSLYEDKVDSRKALPQNYRLLQVADFICTINLIRHKYKDNKLSKSEREFFYKHQELNKVFFKAIRRKEIVLL